jgi:hypothetical protein
MVNAIEVLEPEKGVPKLELKLRGKFLVTISDTGFSMEKESLAKLFELCFTN